MKKLRMLWSVIKRVKLDKILAGFFVCYFISAFLIMVVEPQITTMGDALWYTFAACTSTGFGDIVASTFLGRLLTVIMTIYEIIIVAMVSGVVVSYYLEVIHRREKETVTLFLDRMEHLTELTPEELQQIQERVRRLR